MTVAAPCGVRVELTTFGLWGQSQPRRCTKPPTKPRQIKHFRKWSLASFGRCRTEFSHRKGDYRVGNEQQRQLSVAVLSRAGRTEWPPFRPRRAIACSSDGFHKWPVLCIFGSHELDAIERRFAQSCLVTRFPFEQMSVPGL